MSNQTNINARPTRLVFIRDFETLAEIGVWDHEKGRTQRIRINVDLTVLENLEHHNDDIDKVVCYNEMVKGIQAIIAGGHINLVETLAEKIMDMTLENDLVVDSRVRVEKLEAVVAANSVGVEIFRTRNI